MKFFSTFSVFLFFPGIILAHSNERDVFVKQLLDQMTLDEKIGQLTQLGASKEAATLEAIRSGGVGSILNAATPELMSQLQKIAITESRLKIPLLFGIDVIHGHKTMFPIPLGEAASWDFDLLRRSAQAAALEAAAAGQHWTFAPMVDISLDPRWGRAMEGAGEDPWLGSRIAEARVRGFQGESLRAPGSLLATVKHFAANGAPEGNGIIIPPT
jgi:beta-glucosidase